MIFLFRSGTPQEKIKLILKATRTHAQNLAKYATIYKLTMLALKHMGAEPGKEGPFDTFFAGLLGGYLVFGRRSKRGHVSSVSKQIVIFGKFVIFSSFRFVCTVWVYGSLWGGLDMEIEIELTNKYSIRPRVSLASAAFGSTLRRHHQKPRPLASDIPRCVAHICGAELGLGHVAV